MTKVLSIKQPWASMIVRGLKRFEVRSWSTAYRGPLIIHASQAAPTRAFADEVFDENPELGKLMAKVGMSSLEDLRALPRSALVGVVTLKDVLTSDAVAKVTTVDDATVLGGLDHENTYWLLQNAIEIEPISGINGKLNLWELDAKEATLFAKRLAIGSPTAFKSSKAGAKLFEWPDTKNDDELDEDENLATLVPSAELAAIVGRRPLTRVDVVKKLWAYIKKNNLQDSKNLRTIHADDKLRRIVGREKIDMFKMTSKVMQHLRYETE